MPLTALEDLAARHPYDGLQWLWIPEVDPLRDDPRYVAIARRFNLDGVEADRTPRTEQRQIRNPPRLIR